MSERAKLDLDFFRPFVAAVDELERCKAAHIAARDRANEIIHKIETRQASDRQRLSEMISELEREEANCRKKISAATTARAKASLSGEKPPEMDISIAARLVAIPEEKSILQALIGTRRLTDGEREEWEAALSILRETEAALTTAKRARVREDVRLKDAIEGDKWALAFTAASDVNSLSSKIYALNRDGGEDMDDSADEPETEEDEEAAALVGRKLE